MMPKAKNPQLPKVPLTDLDTHIGITDLDTIYGSTPRQGRAEADPLAELERMETMEAVQELKDLQRQKKMLEHRKRVERLKEEVGAEDTMGGGLAIGKTFNFNAADLQGIANLPPEERQKFLDTIKEISIMSTMAAPGGKMNPIMQLAMMGGFNRGGQQGLTAKDVIELQQNLNAIYQSSGGNRDMSQQLLLKLMTETLPGWQNQAFQAQNQAYQQQITSLKDQISDPIKDIRYIKEAAGMLGMAPTAGDREVSLARMQMEDRWKLEEFKIRREELNASKLLGTVEQILKNVDVPGMVRAATRQQVGEQFRQPQPAPGPALPPDQAAGVGSTQLVKYVCPNPQCKAEIYAPASQAQVTCQNCGGTYTVKPGSVRPQ